MKIKEDLTPTEAREYAEKNGFNSVMFEIKLNDKYIVSGKFIDAYYDIIEIPILGQGYIRLKALCEEYGERILSLDIIDEEDFKNRVNLDFILRGKYMDIPSEYKLECKQNDCE